MFDRTIVLGLAPTRRDTRDFDLCYAHERKAQVDKRVQEIAAKVGNVRVVNIDFLNGEGLMIFPTDAEKVAAEFKKQGVDAVIVPHCNFGSEEAVSLLGKLMQKPLLLWGPRDDAPPASGPRQTDTQCGLFASGMVLDRYNVKFSYLENCRIDSPKLDEGLAHFLRVASVVKTFRTLRVGQVSVRPRTFLTVKVNENELLERFGIEVVTIDYTEMTMKIQSILDEDGPELKKFQAELSETYDTTAMEPETVRRIAAMELGFIALAEQYGINCYASECWRTFSVPFGIMPCAGFADLIRRGLPVACEGDIHGAISSAILSAAAMHEQPHFLADLTIRHPENDNAELLWHCGPFPANMAREGVKPRMENCLGQFEAEHGDVTVCRFGATHGEYRMFIGEGRGVDGPATNGNYLWLETQDWPKWERKLVKGPYIHHISALYGQYAAVLQDACDYVGVEAEMADD